jgi:hypothetical protein
MMTRTCRHRKLATWTDPRRSLDASGLARYEAEGCISCHLMDLRGTGGRVAGTIEPAKDNLRSKELAILAASLSS